MPKNKPTGTAEPVTPLRQRAEEMLRTRRTDVSQMSAEDLRVLVHELEVHQIELELQNEELREAQIELAESRDQYSDLYEFAPTGYVTLDPDGKILNANLTAATMLGVERQHLLRANISNFVIRESQDDCFLHRRTVFGSRSRQTLDHDCSDAPSGQSPATSATDLPETKQTCELQMRKADGTVLTVRLESIAFGAENGRCCRTTLIDLTAERRMQRQIQESEQRYRRLAEAVIDYIFTVRLDHGRTVETIHGPHCEDVTGYTPDEFAANNLLWISIVPPEDRQAVEQHVQQLFVGEQPAPLEHRIRRKDGAVRWVLRVTSPHFDSQGCLIAYDGLLRDITARKQAEEMLQRLNEELEQRVEARTAELRARTDQLAAHSRELEQREQQLRLFGQAISNLGEGVLITSDDLDWPGPQIVFVNDAMSQITGYTSDELIGQSPRVLQGEDTDRETLDGIKSELSAGRSVLAEVTNYRKDGTPYDAELYITPLFDATGHRTNFVSIHRDVTQRKRAEAALREREERLRAVLNTAADAIITIDRRGIINSVNPTTEQMFGYTQDELVGQNVKILMPPPFYEEHDGYIANYLKTGMARIIGIGREVVGRHKDGSTFPVGLAVSEVENLNMFTGIIRDISAVKELQKQVLEIAAEEDRKIGHELHDNIQQQLTGLGLMAKSVAEQLDAVRETEARLFEKAGLLKTANMLTRVADGINRTSQQVHLLSRGLVPVEVDAEGLRAALTELATRVGDQYGVDCHFHCEGAVGVSDNFVATHLYRIAQEAVTNAVKHGRAKQIDISLNSVNDDLTLKVLDNGIGIGDTRGFGPGTGLRIMEYRAGLIGATIRIEPGEDIGTRVSCTVSRGGGSLR